MLSEWTWRLVAVVQTTHKSIYSYDCITIYCLIYGRPHSIILESWCKENGLNLDVS